MSHGFGIVTIAPVLQHLPRPQSVILILVLKTLLVLWFTIPTCLLSFIATDLLERQYPQVNMLLLLLLLLLSIFRSVGLFSVRCGTYDLCSSFYIHLI